MEDAITTNATRYFYDGEGRRVKRITADGKRTYYVYDGMGRLVAEHGDGAGGQGRQFLHTDGLGSTRVVTTESGAVISRRDYFPFGEEIEAGLSYSNGRDAGLYGTAWNGTIRFTGKERDQGPMEWRNDYFGARYMSAAQGRFTSPDPLLASGRAETPQTWNRYAYVLNNPLRFIDRTGLYEEDVHRDLTFALALAAGIAEPASARIAAANQGVDDNPRTSPMGMSPIGEAVSIRQNFHFTSPERRQELYGRFESTGSPEHLGVFFHAQQDSYSHAGYGPRLGHLRDGHSPDKTFTDPAKADRMAANTFGTLIQAASRVEGGGGYRPLSEKTVSKYTAQFNRATNAPAKQRILNQLVHEARENIARQDLERERERKRGGQ